MPKRALAVTASIPVHLHVPRPDILHQFVHLPPPLEDFTCTIRAFPRSGFSFVLDFWQFENNYRHDGLFVDWLRDQYLIKEFVIHSKPTVYVTEAGD
jgi:hypothetical protein